MDVRECINDLFRLGVIQGEHNGNWADEHFREESCNEYYLKTVEIADRYNVLYSDNPEEYREESWETLEYLQDRLTHSIQEKTKETILNILEKRYQA